MPFRLDYGTPVAAAAAPAVAAAAEAEQSIQMELLRRRMDREERDQQLREAQYVMQVRQQEIGEAVTVFNAARQLEQQELLRQQEARLRQQQQVELERERRQRAMLAQQERNQLAIAGAVPITDPQPPGYVAYRSPHDGKQYWAPSDEVARQRARDDEERKFRRQAEVQEAMQTVREAQAETQRVAHEKKLAAARRKDLAEQKAAAEDALQLATTQERTATNENAKAAAEQARLDAARRLRAARAELAALWTDEDYDREVERLRQAQEFHQRRISEPDLAVPDWAMPSYRGPWPPPPPPLVGPPRPPGPDQDQGLSRVAAPPAPVPVAPPVGPAAEPPGLSVPLGPNTSGRRAPRLAPPGEEPPLTRTVDRMAIAPYSLVPRGWIAPVEVPITRVTAEDRQQALAILDAAAQAQRADPDRAGTAIKDLLKQLNVVLTGQDWETALARPAARRALRLLSDYARMQAPPKEA
jgi:murein DD-endopeptidase MepM/ murein hydrolase activator NlpD